MGLSQLIADISLEIFGSSRCRLGVGGNSSARSKGDSEQAYPFTGMVIIMMMMIIMHFCCPRRKPLLCSDQSSHDAQVDPKTLARLSLFQILHKHHR